MLAIQAPDILWNPLAQQSIEPDTTFLLDPDGDTAAGYVPGYSGLINGPNPPTFVAGKYRKGVQPQNAGQSYVRFPCDGLLGPDQFTIEFWAKATTDWTALPARQPLLSIGDSAGSLLLQPLGGSPGRFQVAVRTQQNPASLPSYAVDLLPSYTVGQFPANTWVSIALTLLSGTLTLYFNAVQAAVGAFVPPKYWGSGNSGAIYIGSDAFASAGAMVISDVRISRLARVPSGSQFGTGRSTVVVGAATGATIQSQLAGVLHGLNGSGSSGDVHSPPSAADSYQSTNGAIKLIRTDKMLIVTPIKAGGTDATHPSLGHSGAYSYDWQVVDRSVGYINTLGCQLYLSLDYIPQLLGGTQAPYSGTQLTTGYAYDAGNGAPGPLPSGQNAAFATMCSDLVYHIVTEKGWPVPYIGLWNEPDGGSTWETGANAINDYLTLYQAVMPGIRTVAPTSKLGGPEISSWTNSSWIQNLISFCKTNNLPLDFVSWHFYSGGLAEPYQVATQVAAWASAAGAPTPLLVSGEGSWNFGNLGIWPWQQPPGAGPDPGPDTVPTNYSLNDWEAAYLGAGLVQLQANGVVASIFDILNGVDTNLTQVIDANGRPLATYNVLQMWSMMAGNSVLAVSGSQDPGVFAIASKNNTTGKTSVFLASVHYRKTSTFPVLIDLTGTGIADGTPVTVYAVDDAHSNQWDAGLANAGLQTISTTQPAGVVKGGKVGVVLRPRAVALAVIG